MGRIEELEAKIAALESDCSCIRLELKELRASKNKPTKATCCERGKQMLEYSRSYSSQICRSWSLRLVREDMINAPLIKDVQFCPFCGAACDGHGGKQYRIVVSHQFPV